MDLHYAPLPSKKKKNLILPIFSSLLSLLSGLAKSKFNHLNPPTPNIHTKQERKPTCNVSENLKSYQISFLSSVCFLAGVYQSTTFDWWCLPYFFFFKARVIGYWNSQVIFTTECSAQFKTVFISFCDAVPAFYYNCLKFRRICLLAITCRTT